MASHPVHRLSADEYLEQDRANPFRSEYIDGEMLAMAGGSLRHSALAVNCCSELKSKLAGRGCAVFSSDARVHTPLSGSYVYPDSSVVCGAIILHDDMPDVLTNPVLIVEVLSPTTKYYDRSRKFDLYREIESLKEYLLVDTDSVTIGHFSRQPDNSWLFREASGTGSKLVIPALNITLELADIYGDVMNIPG